MLLLQRQGKTVDNGSKNLEKLSDPIEPLRFVDELEKHVVYRSANVRTQVEKFAVDTVQRGLEEVTFSRIF